jgi:hypothetical protein
MNVGRCWRRAFRRDVGHTRHWWVAPTQTPETPAIRPPHPNQQLVLMPPEPVQQICARHAAVPVAAATCPHAPSCYTHTPKQPLTCIDQALRTRRGIARDSNLACPPISQALPIRARAHRPAPHPTIAGGRDGSHEQRTAWSACAGGSACDGALTVKYAATVHSPHAAARALRSGGLALQPAAAVTAVLT